MLVLVLNSGSSSVKMTVIDPASGQRHWSGQADRLRGEGAHQEAVRRLLGDAGVGEGDLAAAGHRVVHGGERFVASRRVDEEVLAGLRDVVALAPLHLPGNLAGIEAVTAALPHLPQVVVFDTAFHATMPPVAARYAVPDDWYTEHHLRRYGFHGISHDYVSRAAGDLLGRPREELCLVTAHLGNGCSAAAVRHGRSVDTTMGLTPLEGLVMGTRSGDIDPSAVTYLAGVLDVDAEEVVRLLNRACGLLGVSGVSNDMREVRAAAAGGNAAAALALELFAYRLAKHVAGLVVPLGRLDALVFTGGIGEHSAETRADVIHGLGFLGLALDEAANAQDGRETGGRISPDGAAVTALVVPTDEELLIARDTAALLP